MCVFFFNNPTKEQILNPEIVTVPVVEKTKSTGFFGLGGASAMKCSGNSFSFKVDPESVRH